MNNKIMLSTIVLIFLLLTAFNFGEWYADYKYKKASGITMRLDKVMYEVQSNQTIYKELYSIREDIQFINGVCFR